MLEEVDITDNVYNHYVDEVFGKSQSIDVVSYKVDSFIKVIEYVEAVEK